RLSVFISNSALSAEHETAQVMPRMTPVTVLNMADAPDLSTCAHSALRAPCGLFRRCNRTRRKNRGRCEVGRPLAGQAFEKCDDVTRVCVAEGYPELHAGHDLDRFRQRRDRPVVKIRRRHGYVP